MGASRQEDWQTTKKELKSGPNLFLKRERKLRGWSQKDVADAVGATSPHYVSRWERGIIIPSPYYQQKLCELFSKNAQELGFLLEEASVEELAIVPLYDKKSRRRDVTLFHREEGVQEDWGEAPDVENFYGREEDFAEVTGWIIANQSRLVAIVGTGGIGKTSFSLMVARQVKTHFHSVFWRSLKSAPPLERVLQDCIQFVTNQQNVDLPEDTNAQITSLIEILRKHRCLLILDNIESVMQEGEKSSAYRDGYEGYGKLLQRIGDTQHKSCLLLTSREKPGILTLLEGDTPRVRSLHLPGVEQGVGCKILAGRGLFGTEAAWTELVERYSGNPYALKLVAESIHEVFSGDISRFLQEKATVFGEVHNLLEEQFRRLSRLEQEVLYWLAINREPVSLNILANDLLYLPSKRALFEALASLRRRFMVEAHSNGPFSLQPVNMEYMTERLIEQIWRELEEERLELLLAFALTKAQSKNYVRQNQLHVILSPITKRLLTHFGKTESEKKLKRLLSTLRSMELQNANYAASNILSLLLQLHIDPRGIDFSSLTIRQAYLQGVALQGVNFAHCNLTESIFTNVFGDILCMSFSPNGEFLAAGTTNGEILLWQMTFGTLLLNYQGHTDGVRSVAFNSTGTLLLSGSEDQTIRLWDSSTGTCLHSLQGHNSVVTSVAFSPDDTLIASCGGDQTIRLWESGTGHSIKMLQGHSQLIQSIAFSPNGSMIASGSNDRTVRLWDVRTGECRKIFLGHSELVKSVRFDRSGKLIASCSKDHTIRLWDTATGRSAGTLDGHSTLVRSVDFSVDGNLLASCGDDQVIRIWNVSTRSCIKILKEHTNRIWSVAFSPDGYLLASGGEDHSIRLWEHRTGYCLKTLQGYSGLVWSIALSPDGRFLASGGEDQIVHLWHIEADSFIKLLPGHANRIRTLAFCPTGRIVASGSEDQTIKLWDTNTAQCLTILRGHSHLVSCVAFSPNGKVLASGSNDQTVRLWEIETEHCFTVLEEKHGPIWSVAFSPDNRFVASTHEDRTIRIWDIQTGSCVQSLQGHEKRIWSVVFSPDGRFLASCSDDRTIRLWERATGRCLLTFWGHTDWIRTLAFSPDSNFLASGSYDQTVRIWETNTGNCFAVLQGHERWVRSVAFSRDGETVISGCQDGTIKLWNIHTQTCLRTLRSERPYEGMNITGVIGLNSTQKSTLKALGAIEEEYS